MDKKKNNIYIAYLLYIVSLCAKHILLFATRIFHFISIKSHLKFTYSNHEFETSKNVIQSLFKFIY